MIKSRLFSLIFFAVLLFPILLLPQILLADDINEIAYQNRFLLKAGTVLNNEGKGDCLIFPYYDARTIDGKNQITQINIENFGENGIAAKLRFREGSRGREVFSKDIWIPSAGAWNGKIESNEDGTNAMITSFDNVVWRNDSNSFYLSNPLAGGTLFLTRNIRGIKGGSTLYGYFEVIGEEKTSENIDGKVARLAKSERDCPNTLRGKAFIQRVDDGVSMAYDAVAIGNFSRGQGSLFRSPGSPYPRLDTCEDTLDQLEFQLSKWEVFGPYSVSPSNQGKTSLIVTYPTKLFHYQYGNRVNEINNPFESINETTGETLKTTLSKDGQPLPADSIITLPFSVNVIGLYKDYFGNPMGIDNVSLSTFTYESGEVKLTSDNLAERALIEDFEYLQERFSMYRGLPAVGLVLQEYRDPDQLYASITPVEFSTVWGASSSESVFLPTLLSGPTSGQTGVSYTFTTGGSSSSLGPSHPVQYLIDWGDGTNSGWLAVGTASASHSWATAGVFTVRARARCSIHTDIVSNWSAALSVNVTSEVVSTPLTPTGPTFMVVNKDETYPFDKSYSFTTGGSASSLGHPVEYQFDWKGDGSDLSGWGPFIQSKVWTTGGTFTIRARARCTIDTNVVSNWSNGLNVTVEAVSAPNVLNGPTSGIPNTSYTYSTGGAISNLGHQVQYFFDWGDGTNSGWLPVGVTSAAKAWTAGITDGYKVKTRARCATDPLAVSDWTPELTVKIEFVTAPTTPSGPNKGVRGDTLTYMTGGAFSNIGDPVEYQFDWNGDGITDLSPWGSNTQSKTWTAGGNFSVRARARCVTHTSVVSSWSLGLAVTVDNPAPTLASILPTGGNRLQTLDVVFTGTNFISGVSSVSFGADITVNSTTVDSNTQIRANITIAGTAATGARNVSVTNAAPGGGTATLTNGFTVNNPVPTTSSISPTSKTAGDPSFSLTVNGTNFVSTSVVQFNGSNRATTFVNSTQLTATILVSDLTTAGTFNITVLNPAPGGGTSNAQTFTVNNPVPTTSSISPTSKTAGDPSFPLTVNGTNFVSTSVVQFNGSNRATTFVNSTQLTATILVSDLTTAGTFNITVFNPAPGGGTSNAQTFTVN